MADGYLEKHQADYEARRDTYRRQKSAIRKKGIRYLSTIERPDNEAL